jgi:hypothetical protein
LSFRSENDRLDRRFASAKAKAKVKSPAVAVAAAKSTAGTPGSVSDGTSDHQTDVVVYPFLPPDPTWEAESLGYFVDQHVILQKGLCPGHLEVIPELFSSSSETSSFRPALKAVAYLAYSRQTRVPKHESQAARWYQNALRNTREQIDDIDNADPNQVVGSIMLLGLFEVGSCPFRRTNG